MEAWLETGSCNRATYHGATGLAWSWFRWAMASALLRLAWRQELADEEETLATGVLTSLIDQACGVAVMSRLGRRLAISTLNLKVDHVRSAEARCPATAWAHCDDATEPRAFVRAEVWDTEPSHLIATAQGVFSINRAVAP